MRLRLWLAFIPCLAAVAAHPATAQMRALVAVPYNDHPAAQVAVSVAPKGPRIGNTASICFSASRTGYMTLWNVATNGSVARVFPNAYSQAEGVDQTAMRVEPTGTACVGAGSDSFRFRVDGPAGTEDLYLLWTTRAELQPPGKAFGDATAFAAALQQLGRTGKDEWAVAKATYDIAPVAGPTAPALPPPQGSGAIDIAPTAPPNAVKPPRPGPRVADDGPVQEKPRVFVLAMGANVESLAKTNQDARMFTTVIARKFGVPPGRARMIENATKQDWRDGFEWLRTSARPDDFVFVYFSGHGAQIDDPTGTSSDGKDELLIPYDFEIKHPARARDAIFSQELARWINALPTRNVITVLDACHSAGLYRSVEADVLGARAKFYRMPADTDLTPPDNLNPPATRAAGGSQRVAANGTLFAAAHRDQSALEGAEGGFFTVALLREIAAAHDHSMADVYVRAAARTMDNTRRRQNPEEVGSAELPRRITFGN